MYLYLMSLEEKYDMEKCFLKINSQNVIVIPIIQKILMNFFSEDHIFYNKEGFIGFGDYSVIGKDYLESGFAPYAVAIHIVYFAEDSSLRVHHFVSDSNDDIQNPAKKFYEAVQKLSIWVNENNIPITTGLSGFWKPL